MVTFPRITVLPLSLQQLRFSSCTAEPLATFKSSTLPLRGLHSGINMETGFWGGTHLRPRNWRSWPLRLTRYTMCRIPGCSTRHGPPPTAGPRRPAVPCNRLHVTYTSSCVILSFIYNSSREHLSNSASSPSAVSVAALTSFATFSCASPNVPLSLPPSTSLPTRSRSF
jgi:hypothetical protein